MTDIEPEGPLSEGFAGDMSEQRRALWKVLAGTGGLILFGRKERRRGVEVRLRNGSVEKGYGRIKLDHEARERPDLIKPNQGLFYIYVFLFFYQLRGMVMVGGDVGSGGGRRVKESGGGTAEE